MRKHTESMTWEFRILFLSMIWLPNHHGFSYKWGFSFFLATASPADYTHWKPNLASPVLKRPGISGAQKFRGWNFGTKRCCRWMSCSPKVHRMEKLWYKLTLKMSCFAFRVGWGDWIPLSFWNSLGWNKQLRHIWNRPLVGRVDILFIFDPGT